MSMQYKQDSVAYSTVIPQVLEFWTKEDKKDAGMVFPVFYTAVKVGLLFRNPMQERDKLIRSLIK